MIIKGWTQTGPEALGPYLQNAEKNERVTVCEVRGTVSHELVGALQEMDAYSEGTRCQKPLYHGVISPEPPNRLTPEQRSEAVDALEQKLGFEGHARVVVVHEKLGREHIHIVWTRIDLENMKAVSVSHNYRKHEEVARDLERRFGHERVQGAHAERDGVPRPERSPTRADIRHEERTGISARQVTRDVTEAFRSSDGPDAFQRALEDKGYILANGDRRDFVVVDQAGKPHSLARRLEDLNAAELREYMQPLDKSTLPSAEVARVAQLDRTSGNYSQLDHDKWELAVGKAGLEKQKNEERLQRERDRQTKTELYRKELTKARNRTARAFGQSDGLVSQESAVNRDLRRNLRKSNKTPRPQHPSDHELKSTETLYERAKRGNDKPGHGPNEKPIQTAYERMKAKLHNRELTDRTVQALDNITSRTSLRDDEWDPDRQPEAPGGGRFRSR